jgi:hypothetical protein
MQSRFRFSLRLTILLLTLIGTLLAWQSYEQMTRRLNKAMDYRSIEAYRDSAEAHLTRLSLRIQELEQYDASSAGVAAELDRLRSELKRKRTETASYLRAHAAIEAMRSSGCRVSTREIVVNRRFKDDEQSKQFLAQLSAIRPWYYITTIDLTDTDAPESLIRRIRALCPQSEIRR